MLAAWFFLEQFSMDSTDNMPLYYLDWTPCPLRRHPRWRDLPLRTVSCLLGICCQSRAQTHGASTGSAFSQPCAEFVAKAVQELLVMSLCFSMPPCSFAVNLTSRNPAVHNELS